MALDDTPRTLAAALALLLPAPLLGSDPPTRAAVASTGHFAFHSDFDTNLNDALVVAGSARTARKPELFGAGPEQPCFAGLAPSARAGWNRAVDYYAEIVSPHDWGDRQQLLLRMDLARLEGSEDERARAYVGIGRGLMAAAAPAYRACRWPAQDAENRRFIEGLMPGLLAHETSIAPRLAELYRTPWHGLPILVDLVGTAPPLGANTWILAPGGHVLVSSRVESRDALEIAFHEASHTLVAPWRPDPVPAALQEAARELGVSLPRDLWHPVLFYTTGEVIRRVLEQAGEPGYVPYVYHHDLWRGSWARYREAVEKAWAPYLDGRRALPEAARELMRALGPRPAAMEPPMGS
jgi:hypothetical protein